MSSFPRVLCDLRVQLMNPLLPQTRRQFFRDCAVGLGTAALASLLARNGYAMAPKPSLLQPAPHRGSTPSPRALLISRRRRNRSSTSS